MSFTQIRNFTFHIYTIFINFISTFASSKTSGFGYPLCLYHRFAHPYFCCLQTGFLPPKDTWNKVTSNKCFCKSIKFDRSLVKKYLAYMWAQAYIRISDNTESSLWPRLDCRGGPVVFHNRLSTRSQYHKCRVLHTLTYSDGIPSGNTEHN